MEIYNDPQFVGALALWIGLFIGLVFRIFLPYLQKKMEDPTAKFDMRYLYSGILAFMLIIMEVFSLLAQEGNPIYTMNFWLVIGFGILVGMGNAELTSRSIVGSSTAISAYNARKAETKTEETLAKISGDVPYLNLSAEKARLDEVEALANRANNNLNSLSASWSGINTRLKYLEEKANAKTT